MDLKPRGWKAGQAAWGGFFGLIWHPNHAKFAAFNFFFFFFNCLGCFGVISAKFHLFTPPAPSPPRLFRRRSSAAPGAPLGSLRVPLKEGIREFGNSGTALPPPSSILFAKREFRPPPPSPAPGINEGEAGLGLRPQNCRDRALGNKPGPKNISFVHIFLLNNLFFFCEPYFRISMLWD